MAESLPTPNNRQEKYLNAIAGGQSGDLPTPITREEQYLDAIAKGGGGGGGGNITHYHLTALPQSKTLVDTNCVSFKNAFGTMACKSNNGSKDWVFPIPFGQYEKLWTFIENHNLVLYNENFSGYSDFDIDIYVEDLVKTSE